MKAWDEEPKSLWGNTVFCFFMGAFVGAALSMLYTPQSGEDARAQLMDKTSDLKDRLSDAGRQVAERVSDLTGQASRKVQDKVQDWKGTARDSVHAIGQELQEV